MIIHRRREPMTQDAPELRRGYTIAGYRIERALGAGGMGAVYEATQLSLQRSVALKVIAAGVPVDATLRERFRREAQLQAVIDHPHILPVYEAGESHGRLFIAMRLVRGRTLKSLATACALDQQRGMRMLGDVARALDAAHGAGLVHRDVKPQNILVDPGDYAYLADFGLSRASGEETLTRAGQLLGSISYMSPEQVRGERATQASDIYSFTCVVYECLVGLVPFPRESDHAVLHAHVWEPPPRPSEIRAELPAALDDVIAHGMAKAPDARPQSACALVREAQSALGLEPELTEEDEPTTPVEVMVGADDSSDTELSAPVDGRAGTRRLVRMLTPVLGAIVLLAGASAGYLVSRDPGAGPAARTLTTTANRAPPARTTADARFGADLNAAFSALSGTKGPLERKLARATSTGSQATALARLAAAYRQARAAVARARTPAKAGSTDAAIEAALAHIADNYRRLQQAAQHRRRNTYNAAKQRLVSLKRELDDAVQRLQRLGYRLA
jgi:hypothetical protein